MLDEKMNDTLETDATDAIAQALEIIDSSLRTVCRRELVSSSEVSDLLLDVRSVLAAGELAKLDDLSETSTTTAN
jgi:hypothetical protein